MWPNLQFPEGLVTFFEKILNGNLHFISMPWTTYKFLGLQLSLRREQEVPPFPCFQNFYSNAIFISLTKKYCQTFFLKTIYFEEMLHQWSEAYIFFRNTQGLVRNLQDLTIYRIKTKQIFKRAWQNFLLKILKYIRK